MFLANICTISVTHICLKSTMQTSKYSLFKSKFRFGFFCKIFCFENNLLCNSVTNADKIPVRLILGCYFFARKPSSYTTAKINDIILCIFIQPSLSKFSLQKNKDYIECIHCCKLTVMRFCVLWYSPECMNMIKEYPLVLITVLLFEQLS